MSSLSRAPAEIKEFVLDNLNKDFTAASKDDHSDYLSVYYFMTGDLPTTPLCSCMPWGARRAILTHLQSRAADLNVAREHACRT